MGRISEASVAHPYQKFWEVTPPANSVDPGQIAPSGSSLMKSTLFAQACLRRYIVTVNEPPHDKTNKMACAHSEDLDQPGHLPSLIRVFSAVNG